MALKLLSHFYGDGWVFYSQIEIGITCVHTLHHCTGWNMNIQNVPQTLLTVHDFTDYSREQNCVQSTKFESEHLVRQVSWSKNAYVLGKRKLWTGCGEFFENTGID